MRPHTAYQLLRSELIESRTAYQPQDPSSLIDRNETSQRDTNMVTQPIDAEWQGKWGGGNHRLGEGIGCHDEQYTNTWGIEKTMMLQLIYV